MDLALALAFGLLLLLSALAVGGWQWLRRLGPRLPREKAMAMAYGRMAGIMASDGLVVQDLTGLILWVNPAYCKMMGRTEDEMLGRNPLSFALPPEMAMSEEDIAAFRLDPANPIFARLQVSEMTVFRNIDKSGRRFWNQISLSFHEDEAGKHYAILVCRDVTDQIEREETLRKASETLAHTATHDALTGAANRVKLRAFVDRALASAEQTGHGFGLIQIDLDHFKQVNDLHGHAAGDAVLKHVTNAAQRALRQTDLFARMGGDEFIVACPNISGLNDLQKIAAGIRAELLKPLIWENTRISCDASIGAALAMGGKKSFEDLIRETDFALYDVKRRGRGAISLYDAELDHRQKKEFRRTAELMEAVAKGQIEHHFLPFANAQNGTIVGFETLARWRHPTEGILFPRDFLPLAQDLDMMPQIDFMAFRAANRLSQHLRAVGQIGMNITINCASATLTHPDFRHDLLADVTLRGLRPGDLTLEIKESAIFEQGEMSDIYRRAINQLCADGFDILLDDFAAGYTGLTHLNQLPIAGFKIDRFAVRDILSDPINCKVAAMILELSHDLGLFAVAEGIETMQQVTKFVAIGGRYVQGHLLSPALPADAVADWLAARPAALWDVPSMIAPADPARYLGANS